MAALRVVGDDLKLEALYDTRLPGQSYFGAMPDAVAVSADGKRLFAANTGSDSIAVFDLSAKKSLQNPAPAREWVPTEWYPTALAVKGNTLYVATAKGEGTGPNNMEQPRVPGEGDDSQLDLHRHLALWIAGRHRPLPDREPARSADTDRH